MKNINYKKILSFIIPIMLLVGIDQISKLWAVRNLKVYGPQTVFDKILEFVYLENKGAAFGTFQNSRLFFIIIAVIVICVFIVLYFKIPFNKKMKPLKIVFTFVVSGTLGNLIDRIRLGYVIDFIYFKLIDFPVFNVADIYLTVSMFFIIILLIFYYKDSDFKFNA